MLTRALIRLFVPEKESVPGGAYRASLGLLEGYVSLIVNAALALLKGAIGVMSGSVALLADAVHTLSDCLSSGVLVGGAYLARRPADAEHPFGHGRIEHVAAVAIAILLGVTGIEFGRSSIESILEPTPLTINAWIIGAVVFSMLVKLWNSLFARAIAKEANSRAIEADYWHHLSDVLTTVLALISVVAGAYGVYWLDGVMGIGISLVILWVTWTIAKGAISPLLGEAPSREEVDEIKRMTLAIDGVRDAHDIIVHRYGDLRLVSLHIEISNTRSLWESHNIAEAVQRQIGKAHHGTVTVHVDPVNDDHPCYAEIEKLIAECIKESGRLTNFHDLRLIGEKDAFAVVFDVSSATPISAEDQKEIRRKLLERLKSDHPGVREVAIEFEPIFSYTNARDELV